jgi:hypothetical protein
MAEVLQEYATLLRGRDDRMYQARAVGRERDDGTWEGWLEFLPADGLSAPLASGRETTQPNRNDLVYWATGLTDPYLDGALLRLLTRVERVHHAAPPQAATDRPAERAPAATSAATAAPAVPPPVPVLDPYHVYAEGAEVLRSQLYALSEPQLRNIVRAYGMSDMEPARLDVMKEPELVALIMTAVARRAADAQQG